jgi:hypothetical protein
MNRRIFDGIVLVGLFMNGALILPRMAARRWSREETNALRTAGDALQIGLGQ